MRWAAALPLALLLCAVGCGEPTTAPDAPAEETPAPPEPTPPPEAVPEPDPVVPAGDLRGDTASGRELYALYCATCHGQGGKGDGPAGQVIDPRPRDHTDATYMGTLTDQDLYSVIKQGGVSVGKSPLMIAWGGVISEQGLRDLVAYVRSLSGT